MLVWAKFLLRSVDLILKSYHLFTLMGFECVWGEQSVLGQGVLEMPSWEAGGSLPGSTEMSANVKGRLGAVEISFAPHFLSSGRKCGWGSLFSLKAVWRLWVAQPHCSGMVHLTTPCVCSKVVSISDFLLHLDEKSPPGWQPPQIFLIVIQSIRVINSVRYRSRWELSCWFLLSLNWNSRSGLAVWLQEKNLAGGFGAGPGSACPIGCHSETPKRPLVPALQIMACQQCPQKRFLLPFYFPPLFLLANWNLSPL